MSHEYECVACEKTLTNAEVDRYYQELGEWARKHPDVYSQYDERDESLIGQASGVWMDCDQCAVERLQRQRDMLASKTFMERVAEGGPEALWLVAAIILGLLVLCCRR